MTERRKTAGSRFLMCLQILSIALLLNALVPMRVSADEFPPVHPFKEIFEKDLASIDGGIAEIIGIFVEQWFSGIDAAHVHISYVDGLSQSQEISLQFEVMYQLESKWYVRYADPNWIYTPPELPPPDPPFEVGALNVGFVEPTIVPDDYSTIQGAINNVPETSIVFVRSGTYSESVRVNKTLSLIGESRDGTILNGIDTLPTMVIEADNVRISGFGFEGWSFGNIIVSSANGALIVENRIIFDALGIDVESSANITIENNIINGFGLDNTGIMLAYSSGCSIVNNTINDAVYDGIRLWFSSNNVLERNLIEDNDYGIFLHGSNENTLSENTILKNGGRGIYFEDASFGNTILHNNFIDNCNSVGFYDSSANVWNNGSEGNYWSEYGGVDSDRNGIGGTPYIIDTNNRDNYPLMHPYGSIQNLNTKLVYLTIQAAINAASDGDTIFVRNGTYYENIVISRRVSVVGEDRNNTMIDGNGTGTVVQITSSGVSLSGFTIRKSGSGWSSGIALLGLNENCTITDNIIVNNSWGIEIAGNSNGTDISSNIIADNGQGITLFYGGTNSDTIIRDNIITDNKDSGIWIWSQGSMIVNNSLIGNHHGIYLSDSANGTIYHNNFVNNTIQVFSVNSLNDVWDNGCEGNYWSDYSGADSDGDGVGDTPYIIDSNNVDHCPLMNPYWNPADINHDLKVDLKDVYATGRAYGSEPGMPMWNPHCDIIADAIIDLKDYYAVCKNFGKSYTGT